MSADPEQEVFFGSRSSSRKINGLGRLDPQNPAIYELITLAERVQHWDSLGGG